MKLAFPKGFYWGSSTSAHQVEGGNFNDWSEWEQRNCHRLAQAAKKKWLPWQLKKFPEMLEPENYVSGWASDHYNRYEEDFDIAQKLNQNAHRFSLEWSRIEPENGQFNQKEIEHYRKVIRALIERKIEPFVTLWHWTNPIWISKMGGWENKKTVGFFLKYVEKVADELGSDIKFWIPINEPAIPMAWGYITGYFPPGKRNIVSAVKVMRNLKKAHQQAYILLHQKFPKKIQVGSTALYHCYSCYNQHNPLDQALTWTLKYFGDEFTTDWAKKYGDFVGLDYYFADIIKFSLWRGKYPLVQIKNPEDWVSDLGWYVYPEGIYRVLKDINERYNKPIYITENGIADKRDKTREKFIKENLYWTNKAIKDGVKVKGYFYWSLLDNFEWDKGFWPRFGLVAVDRKNMKRRIRSSAKEYAKICESNQLETKEEDL